jgi:uncharacterized protein involved in cysteine biosynthesis
MASLVGGLGILLNLWLLKIFRDWEKDTLHQYPNWKGTLQVAIVGTLIIMLLIEFVYIIPSYINQYSPVEPTVA